jgi:hypothetical protein
LFAQRFGQKEAIDVKQAERGPAEEPADDLAGLRVRDEDRQRPVVAIPRLKL